MERAERREFRTEGKPVQSCRAWHSWRQEGRPGAGRGRHWVWVWGVRWAGQQEGSPGGQGFQEVTCEWRLEKIISGRGAITPPESLLNRSPTSSSNVFAPVASLIPSTDWSPAFCTIPSNTSFTHCWCELCKPSCHAPHVSAGCTRTDDPCTPHAVPTPVRTPALLAARISFLF